MEACPWLPRKSRVRPCEDSPVADALWVADMTTGPRGEELAYDERLSEILDRYGRESVVGRAMLRAEPAIRAAIEQTHHRMQDAYTIGGVDRPATQFVDQGYSPGRPKSNSSFFTPRTNATHSWAVNT
jgi:hypothetical protein